MTSTPGRRISLQLLILTIGLIAIVSIHEYLREQQTSEINTRIEQASLHLNQSISILINSSLASTSAISQNIAQAYNDNQNGTFQSVSRRYLQDHPYTFSVSVINPDGEIRWTYPGDRKLTAQTIPGIVNRHAALLNRAIAQKQTLRTLDSQSNMLYYQIYTPLPLDNKAESVLLSLVDLTPVIGKLTRGMDTRLAFSIQSPDGIIVWRHPETSTVVYSERVSPLPVDGDAWQLHAGWTDNPSILATNLYLLNWGTGLILISILLATVHHSGTFADRLRYEVGEKTSALESANRHLLDVISERIQSEKKLEFSERRYRLLFNNANDAVFVQHILDDGSYSDFIEVNDVACKMLGYDRETLCTRSMLDFTPPEAYRQLSYPSAHPPTGVHQLFESVLVSADDRNIPIEISSHSFELMGQQTVLSIVRDITERKQAEKEVRERREELAHAARYASMGKLASGLAHEINQPLSAITNYINGGLRRIEMDNLSGDELQSVMKKIAEQAQRAASILSGMRDFIRKRKPRRGEIEINALIRQTLELLQSEIKSNSIIVTQELGNHHPMIVADAIQIEQVLMNLVKNAIEALMEMPSSGERRLLLKTESADDNTIKVSVQDNGPGLPAEISAHLFESFNTTKPQGMGLGLSICRSIIEAHGGRLWADTKLKTGARFCFTIPQYLEGPEYE